MHREQASRVAWPAALLALVGAAYVTAVHAQAPAPLNPRRLATNPLITVSSSSTLGGNVNGPTVIRVPSWVERPLGKYYMYFANHMGEFVRCAYADAVTARIKAITQEFSQGREEKGDIMLMVLSGPVIPCFRAFVTFSSHTFTPSLNSASSARR